MVTGAGGYIGTQLVKDLVKAGHEVTAVDRFFFGKETLSEFISNKNVNIVKKDIRLENYKTVLFSRGSKDIDQRSFRSYGHKVYTELINKIALSSTDDKIHVMDNNIDTLSFGHYKIKV